MSGTIIIKNETDGNIIVPPVGKTSLFIDNNVVKLKDENGLVTIVGPYLGYVTIPFNYNDPSPKLVAVVPANKVVSQVNVIINTPFTDPAATVSLGTLANTNLLLSATDSKPNIVGSYAALPGVKFLSDTHIILTINPGTSSAGVGWLVLFY
jgi:hypothetical protein